MSPSIFVRADCRRHDVLEDGLGLGSGLMYEDQRGKDSSRFGEADPQLEPLE